jgi:hypothetical protein
MNHRIRRINTSGTITTIAGIGTSGYSGDGGMATDAKINAPFGITIDATGNLYFADGGNNVVRKINTSGIITTVVGNGYGAAGLRHMAVIWGDGARHCRCS